ncbi:MAG TPA: ComEC/Rec2 family competence protein, partial [Daejeonella sp.]|nr:ComEC/Rec2 family competence protein [Daejeonella sp.]
MKGEIPFVRFIIPLILGIALAMWFSSAWMYQYAFILILLVLGVFIVQIVLYQKLSLFKKRWVLGLTVHLFLALVGYWITLQTAQWHAPNYFSRIASEALIVKLVNEPKLNGDILRFETEVTQASRQKHFEPVCGKLLIALKTDSLHPLNLEYGDLLLIPGSFNEVEPAFNPGEFDFKAYLASKQIYHQTFINQKQILVLKKDAGNPVISFALRLRKKLVDKFYR